MQDGGYIGLGANENIVFLIAYTISFPKMYSFQTLQKIPTKLHSKPDYMSYVVNTSRIITNCVLTQTKVRYSTTLCCRQSIHQIAMESCPTKFNIANDIRCLHNT